MNETQHFAWLPGFAPFDPGAHARFDLPWRSLTIEGAEGKSATATVEMVNPGSGLLGPGQDRFAHIALTRDGVVHHLFSGRLLGAPNGIAGDFVQAALDCRFGDLDAAIRTAVEPTKTPPAWDELFVDPNRVDEPMEALEALHAHMFVDPRTQDIRISDALLGSARSSTPATPALGEIEIEVPAGLSFVPGLRVRVWYRQNFREHFTGLIVAYDDTTLTIDADTFEGAAERDDWVVSLDIREQDVDGDSINVAITHKPYSAVKCIIEAQWTQSANDSIDLTAKIKEAAGAPNIRTLSFPDDFAETWPRPGEAVGGPSGYTVKTASLEQQLAGESSGAVIVALNSWAIFAVNTYKPQLEVTYVVDQKRVETATFILAGHAQELLGDLTHVELLELKLQDVGPALPSRLSPTFFLTDRGKQAVAHGIHVAKTAMAESQRCVEVSAAVKGWPVEALYLNCDQSVCLHSPKLPGGFVIGKVAAFALRMDEAGREASFTLKCSVGLGYVPAETESDNDYVDDEYVDDGYVNGTAGIVSTGGGEPLTYAAFDDQQPTDALAGLPGWSANDFVVNLDLGPLADEQLAYLQAHQLFGPEMWRHGTSPLSPERTLKEKVPTKMVLQLRSLASQDELRHSIAVSLTGAWGLPPTIDLAAA